MCPGCVPAGPCPAHRAEGGVRTGWVRAGRVLASRFGLVPSREPGSVPDRKNSPHRRTPLPLGRAAFRAELRPDGGNLTGSGGSVNRPPGEESSWSVPSGHSRFKDYCPVVRDVRHRPPRTLPGPRVGPRSRGPSVPPARCFLDGVKSRTPSGWRRDPPAPAGRSTPSSRWGATPSSGTGRHRRSETPPRHRRHPAHRPHRSKQPRGPRTEPLTHRPPPRQSSSKQKIDSTIRKFKNGRDAEPARTTESRHGQPMPPDGRWRPCPATPSATT